MIHLSLTKLCPVGEGCPVRRPLLTLGWLHLSQGSWRPRVCPRRRWRDILPDRSGRWHLSSSLGCRFGFVWYQIFDFDFFFFLTTQKAGKALLALKRMALLSKGDGSSPASTTPQEGETIFFYCCISTSRFSHDIWQSHGFLTFSLNFFQNRHCHQRQWMLWSLWSTRCRNRLRLLRGWRTRLWLQALVPDSHVTSQVDIDCHSHFVLHFVQSSNW